jgi:intermediate cleaving peptidase 55
VKGYTYTLYVPPKDAHEEQWEGARTGPDAAVAVFGADAAYPNSDFASHLPGMIDKVPAGHLFVQLPPSASPSPSLLPYISQEHGQSSRRKVSSSIGKLLSGSSIFASPEMPPHIALHQLLNAKTALPLAQEVDKLRLVKSSNELALMKQAGDISSQAHTRVMKSTTTQMKAGRHLTEGMLAAEFEYHCAMAGSERPAYVPVVASGSVLSAVVRTGSNVDSTDGPIQRECLCYSLYAK